jgi:hypothetical protein
MENRASAIDAAVEEAKSPQQAGTYNPLTQKFTPQGDGSRFI